MKNLFFGLLALGLCSCGDRSTTKPADELASNDFEQLEGWQGGTTNPSLNREKAHSGLYSVKVDPAIEYSMGYNNQLGRLSLAAAQNQAARLGVFAQQQSNRIVSDGDKNPNEAKNALYDSYDLAGATKAEGFNKWVEVEKTITLPETVTYDSRMLVYLWRGNSSQAAYLDDLQVIKVE